MVLCALAADGCHSMRFVVSDQPQVSSVNERKSFFLFGLLPTRRIDVSQKCPAGVIAIYEERNAVDVLLDLITLDIYTPRTTTYYCAEGGQQ